MVGVHRNARRDPILDNLHSVSVVANVEDTPLEIAVWHPFGRSYGPTSAQQAGLLPLVQAFEAIDITFSEVALLIVTEAFPQITNFALRNVGLEVDSNPDSQEVRVAGMKP